MSKIGGNWRGNLDPVGAPPPSTGDVAVTVNDQAATWTLTAPGYSSGTQTGNQTLVGLDYATYTATFDDNLIQFTSPAPDAGVLDSPTLALSGTYAARSTGDLSVNIQPAGAEGATWTVISLGSFAVPFSEGGTGDATLTGPCYQGRDYQITYNAEAGYSLPTPNPDSTTLGATHTFLGTYVLAAADDINIVMQDELSAPLDNGLQPVTWTLYKDGAVHLTGDNTTAMPLTGQTAGDYFVQWGWARDYWPPHAYETDDTVSYPVAVPPKVAGTYAGEPGAPDGTPQQTNAWAREVPWSGPTQTMSGSALTFTGRYTSRAVPAKNDLPAGSSMNRDIYWEGADTFIDCMQHRSFDGFSVVPIANRDAHGWTISGTTNYRIRLNSPPGYDGVQRFWLFWEGQGAVSIDEDGIPPRTLSLSDGNPGSVGQPGGGGVFFDVDTGPDSDWTAEDGTGLFHITSNVGGANHLRNLELVWEGYCGTPASAAQTTDDFRVNPLTTESRWFAEYQRITRFLTYTDHVDEFNWYEEAEETANRNDVDYAGTGRTMDTFTSLADDEETPHCYRDILQQKIDIANASNSDLWVCMPPFKNISFWNDHIDMIEAAYSTAAKKPWEPNGLNPANAVYWEYNETWFSIFPHGDYFQFWGNYYIDHPTDHKGRLWSAVGPTPIADPTGALDGFENANANDIPVEQRTHTYHLWLFGEEIRGNANYQAAATANGWTLLQDRHRILLGQQTAQDGYYAQMQLVNFGGSGDPAPYEGPWTAGQTASFDGVNPALDNFYGISGTNYTSAPHDYPTVNGIDVSDPGNWEEAAWEWLDNSKTLIIVGNPSDTYKPDWLGNIQVVDWLPNRTDGGRLKAVGYEGGSGDTLGDTVGAEGPWAEYLRYTHQHYPLHKHCYKHFRNAGFEEACHYTSPSAWPDVTYGNYTGNFGIKESMHMPDSAAYRWMAHVDYCHEYPADW